MSSLTQADIVACLRAAPPEPFASHLAAGIMAADLMRTNKILHGCARIMRWRGWPAKSAWYEIFRRVEGTATKLIGGTADHAERGGFDEAELARLEDELVAVFRMMMKIAEARA